MKSSILQIILLLCIILIAGAGSCNRTSIRNQGSISADAASFRMGQTYALELVVPEFLEGRVHRATWQVDPPGAAEISYEDIRYTEYDTTGDSTTYTLDRKAEFVALKAGTVTVKVFMFHHPQTSPQLFAEKEFVVHE